MKFLEVEDIHKSFGENEVLKGVSFNVNKGEVLVIIGASGSGKTTLLRSLNFLETPEEGSIKLNGEILFDAAVSLKKRELEKEIRLKRLHFGLVFQSFNLFPQYSVIQNVVLAMDIHSKEQIKKNYKISLKNYKETKSALASAYAANKEKAVSIIERVGLKEKINQYPCELSGGQCQRVAIARALALEPDILCFDEPTSALDPELTGEVLKVIKGLKSSDRTMIVVTHEMEFARGVADKVIFMADGIIEEEGTPDEVFGNPKSEKTIAFLRKSEERI